jgi:hypothetical protein
MFRTELARIQDRYRSDLLDIGRVAGSRSIEEIGACTVEMVSRLDVLKEIEDFIEDKDEDITSR